MYLIFIISIHIVVHISFSYIIWKGIWRNPTRSNSPCLEGSSIRKPPLFNLWNYNHWRAKMTVYLQFLEFNLLDVVMNVPFTPTNIKNVWVNRKKIRNYLPLIPNVRTPRYCALNADMFNSTSSYKNTMKFGLLKLLMMVLITLKYHWWTNTNCSILLKNLRRILSLY